MEQAGPFMLFSVESWSGESGALGLQVHISCWLRSPVTSILLSCLPWPPPPAHPFLLKHLWKVTWKVVSLSLWGQFSFTDVLSRLRQVNQAQSTKLSGVQSVRWEASIVRNLGLLFQMWLPLPIFFSLPPPKDWCLYTQICEWNMQLESWIKDNW